MIKNKKAFTILEMIMVITVVGFFSAGIAPFMWQLVESYKLIAGIQETSASAKMALEWMAREIREIKIEDNSLRLHITTADTNDIEFYKTNGERVEYKLDANDAIKRNNDILVEGVESLSFKYYDVGNNELGPLPLRGYNRKKIHHMKIILTISNRGEQYTVSSYVVPRSIIMQ